MSKSALLVLDLVNELVHEDGKFAGMGYPAQVKERGVLEAASSAIGKARAKGMSVIFVRVGFSPDYRECPESSPLLGAAKQYGALQIGDWATEFHASLDRRDSDETLTKHRVNAFFGTPLDKILKAKGIDTILLGGVATDLVVQTTARDGHDRDYAVVVLEDMCAASSPELHDSVIGALGAVARIDKTGSAPELN